jgi:hypothetical protein
MRQGCGKGHFYEIEGLPHGQRSAVLDRLKLQQQLRDIGKN